MAKQKITTINGVDIYAETNENGIFVPVKPICQALGVAFERQYTKIQEDEDLAPTVTLRVMVGADGKEREMVCLPLEYVYGWLFTINPKNVSDGAREKVRSYRMECYHALYDHFSGSMQRTIQTNQAEISLLQEINTAIGEEREAKARRKKAEESLQKLRAERLDPQPRLL